MASRRAVVRHYGGPDVLQPDDGEAAAPAAGEVRIRQRAIGVNYIDVYLRKGWIPAMLPLPGVPGMEAAGTVVDVGAGRQRLPARRPGRLPRPAARRLLQRPHRAGRLGGAPADGGGGRRRRGDPAQGPHRRLPAARPRPGRAGHAAPGPCRGRRRRPARLVLGAPARRHRDRHGLERGQGARRARVRLRVSDRRPRPPLRRDGAVALRRRRRGDRRHRRCGAARRTSPRWPGAATGSASARPAARCSRSRPTAWWRSRSPSRARSSSTTPRAPPTWRRAPAGVWQALADGTLKAPPIERHALGAADEAHRRLESRRTIGALVLIA